MNTRSSILRISALAFAVIIAIAAACADPPPTAEPTPPLPAIAKAPPAAPTPAHIVTPSPAPTHTVTPPPAPAHTATPSPTPTEADPPPPQQFATSANLASLGAVSQLALGELHACGLREDGRAVCVGYISNEVDQTAAFSDISSGRYYFCGLRDDGAIFCRGDSPHCETCAPDGVFSALSAGKRHACALNADGEAVCWGWDSQGRATPPPGARFSAIAAGGAHSCGIAEFGNLICWGGDSHGQSNPNEGPFAALALGSNHVCALRTDGSAFCQGSDSHGQASPPPTVFAKIAAGENQTCGITPEGGLECWGIVPVSDYSEKFASVSVGYGGTCALTAAGAPKCWPSYEPPPEDPTNGAWLESAVEMFPMPAGGVAVAERRGRIDIYPPEGGKPRTALDLTERTSYHGYEGMLSAALDPDFARFPFIYVYWHTDEGSSDDDTDLEGRVSRFTMTLGGDADADSELVILRIRQIYGGHTGGSIRFGADGMMYFGLGDNTREDRASEAPSDDLSALTGKIIRIDVRGATEGAPYRVPPDNPFVGVPGARPEIWALGLRNPWRMSFAPNGDLIVADVGYKSREEISIVERGANLGWPLFEGSRCVSQDARCDDVEGYTFPIHEYRIGDGNCAIIGGMSAPGGGYIFGDYCGGRVWALERTAPDVWSAREIMRLSRPITAFGSDADGTVYALTQFGYAVKAGE